jgi:pyridoxine 5-phosphate synthase
VVTTKLDLEMAATPEIIAIALDVVPDLVTIVPEKREELTTEGGLSVADHETHYSELTQRFHERGIEVSLFIEPESSQIEAAAACGVDIIELHTGTYANARSQAARDLQLERIRSAAQVASQAGLVVTAGHGLDLRNIGPIALIPEIEEVSIGHALVARAMFVGLEQAVREYVLAVS